MHPCVPAAHPTLLPVPEQAPPPPAFDPTVLQAQLLQLTALVQTLQVQNVALQDQLGEQCTATVQPSVPPGPIPLAQPDIKVATRDVFDGSMDHTEEFLHCCEIYFLSIQGLMEVQKVTFTLLYMF
jgi:hypothetical protein